MTVKKWVPCALWDVTGLEQWLGEMAAKGYALKDWPGASFVGRVSFQEDPEALNARYRLDPIGERIGDLELRERSEAYQEVGWDYVGKIGRLYAIYRCDDPTAPELYNDPESLAWAMKKQMRWMWVSLFFWLLYPVVLFWDEWPVLFHYPAQFLMDLILSAEILIPLYAFMVYLVASAMVDGFATFFGICRNRACLMDGNWPQAGARNYPELRHWLRTAIAAAAFILFLFYLGLSDAMKNNSLSGPQDWAFPHVLLEETLPEEVQLREYSDQEMLHFDKLQNSILAPEQYDVAQGGKICADGTAGTEARLYQEHYRVVSPLLARAVYHGRVAAHHHSLEEYRKNWEENTSMLHVNFPNAFDYIQDEELSYPGLDGLTQFTYLYSDEETPNIVYIGLYKDRVFVLNCQGETNGESAISLLVERLLDSVDTSA